MTQVELDIKMSEIEQEEAKAVKPLQEKRERLQTYKNEQHLRLLEAQINESKAGNEIRQVCSEIQMIRATFRAKKHAFKMQLINTAINDNL